jgi:hypothetical protein
MHGPDEVYKSNGQPTKIAGEPTGMISGNFFDHLPQPVV